jgi:hypothetical protein
MDTTTQAALSKAHENLADDLANLSQLIQPESQQALGMLYRTQRRLQDIQELAKFTTKPAEKSEPSHLCLGDLNPLLHSDVADTMAHVRSVLTVLSQLEFEAGAPGDPGDFNLGIHDLFYLLENSLKMHATHGDTLPDEVVLKQAEWQSNLQRRMS